MHRSSTLTPLALALVILALAARPVAAADPRGAPAKSGSLDFNLLGDEKPAAVDPMKEREAAELQIAARRRRVSLQLHQGFGIALVATMAATMIVGQLHYEDRYDGGDDTGRFRGAHLGLGIGSAGLFAATGLLALFAPNPYHKPLKADTALAHKILLAVATVGMAAQVVLGPIVAAREGQLDQRPLALSHLVIGWATLGVTGGGVLAYVF